MPLTGLGPSLSFAGLVLAATLLVVELLARDVSLTLVAAPLGGHPDDLREPHRPRARSSRGRRTRRVAVRAHRAELRRYRGVRDRGGRGHACTCCSAASSSRADSATLFRFFPPLATLDRVNHLAAIAGWLGLTLGVVLAATYSLAYHELNLPQLVWGDGRVARRAPVALGRVARGWQAQRAAKYSSAAFVAVLVLYVAFRVVDPAAGQFL